MKIEYLHGNCIDVLRTLESKSVYTCITSPPYWRLRDYGSNPFIWGGDSSCEHKWKKHFSPPRGGKNHPDRPPNVGANRHINSTDLRGVGKSSEFCLKCGAWNGELGLEPLPEMYVQNIVQIFREVKRILRDDGTLWLNLGDTYIRGTEYKEVGLEDGVLKSKDLAGIPWRVAFALQNDGWYLRSDIVWHKPNAMPEAVLDRPTKCHEYIFLLSKSEKYYYDIDATRESIVEQPENWAGGVQKIDGNLIEDCSQTVTEEGQIGKNMRSVWTVNTVPSPELHFAIFPQKLITPCIKAGCPEGGCVLDPFGGSGTTAVVCQMLNRSCTLIDVNKEYVEIQKKKTNQMVLNEWGE